MDFRFTDKEEALRAELRGWLSSTLAEYDDGFSSISDDDPEVGRSFNKKLAAKGWIAPAWPKEYGGLGATHVEQAIFSEELAWHRAPNGARVFSVGMIGPTLIVHGSPEQKTRHLNGITSGEVIWCQGYSEPGAGSDLAALQTKAVRDGDDYVINGQKIWTTGAHRADWIFVLARTNPEAPKHKGISFFLAPMDSAGITVRPIVNMGGLHEFNEVYFEDVRVPRENLVGKENEGWYVAMTLLDFERSSVAAVASARRNLDDVIDYAKQERHNGVSIASLPHVRTKLAELILETEVAKSLSYRTAWLQQQGKVPSYEASIIKVFATEMAQRVYNTGMGILGLRGALEPDSKWAVLKGRIEKEHLLNVAPTIYSGTNEIQRNIIATRGLGLPRD